MAQLRKRLDATPEELAAWIWAGPKDGGIAAYVIANELDPPPRFHFGDGSGDDHDYVSPLMACWFGVEEIARFKPAHRYITGSALIQRWSNQPGYGVFTSNVDGHFQRAGFDGALVAECHGSIHYLQCSKPCSEATWPADDFVPAIDDASCSVVNGPPTCPWCGAIARPNILMFGDSGWAERRSQQQQARLRQWLDDAGRLVVVELGAGTAIPTVRHFSHAALIDRDAVLVRINAREPAAPRSRDVSIAGPALAVLQAIDEALSAQ